MTNIVDANLPQPGRGYEPAENVGKKEDENPYIKEIRQMAAAKLAAGMFGGPTDKDHYEGLPIKILQSAMENNAQLVKQANDMVEKKEKDVETLRAKADKSQTDLMSMMFSEWGRVSGDLKSIMDKIEKKEPPPRDAITTIKEAKELITMIGGELGVNRAPAQVVPSNEEISLRRQEAQWAHDDRILAMNMELEKMRNDLTFKLQELADKKEDKKREYEDSKTMRSNALSMVTDIAGAAAEGFRAKTGGVASQPDTPGKGTPPPDNNEIVAFVKSFPCQNCGEAVAVPKDDSPIVCPSCSTQYGLKRAGM